MKPLVPGPRTEWTEAAGREFVYRRAAASSDTETRICEVSGATWRLEWSHRVARGRYGTWAPSNGVLMAHDVHGWAHSFPILSRRLGWHVPTGLDPREVPVWLARPWPGFWFLRDDEGPLTQVHPEDHAELDLPTVDELRQLLPPAARGALA